MILAAADKHPLPGMQQELLHRWAVGLRKGAQLGRQSLEGKVPPTLEQIGSERMWGEWLGSGHQIPFCGKG